MKLNPGTYFGETVRQHQRAGLLLTLAKYPPGQKQPWHTHSNPTFFAVVSGEQRDRSHYGEHDQSPWTLVFHPTTEPHAGTVGPRGALGVNVEYNPSWLVAHELRQSDLGGYAVLDSLEARLQIMRILPLASGEGHFVDAELEMQSLELLESLIRTSEPTKGFSVPGWLFRAREFLHTSFCQPVSLRDVAREARVHPVHFARVFRRHFGCSVSDYIRALRVAEAGRLILQEGMALAQAACAAGFFDQAHLSRCFARELRVSPKALRSAGRVLRTLPSASIIQEGTPLRRLS